MKTIFTYLSGIKSRCFMLLACLTLSICATSCGSDELETDLPEEPQQLSKAELIERALRQMPQTRGLSPVPVTIMTLHNSITIRCEVVDSIKINWGDDLITWAVPGIRKDYDHIYSDEDLHTIFFDGSNLSIKSLDITTKDLIFLDVTKNANLEELYCIECDLENLDLTDCFNLKTVNVTHNNLSSIDVSHLINLESLSIESNQLTNLDVSNNLNLRNIIVGFNQITDLDLSKNINLEEISLRYLPLLTLNNLPMKGDSFSMFPNLERLDIINLPFSSLDLSQNSRLKTLHIDGTAITQLDISNVQLNSLCAICSGLTNIICTTDSGMAELYLIRIDGTPFETLQNYLFPFLAKLPDRNERHESGPVLQGHLYTSSDIAMYYRGPLERKNWQITKF